MTENHTEERTYRDYEDLIPEEDVIDRMDDLIDEVEQARYEICLADVHRRYPDSSLHFGQIIAHLEAIKSFIEHRQAHGTDGLSTYSLYQHSTLRSVLDDEDEIERLYGNGIGT
jgi:hypothetical protein